MDYVVIFSLILLFLALQITIGPSNTLLFRPTSVLRPWYIVTVCIHKIVYHILTFIKFFKSLTDFTGYQSQVTCVIACEILIMSIHYCKLSLQSGRISVQYGRISVQYGRISVQYGRISLQSGRISVQYGRISVQYGRISVQSGRISLQSGRISVQYGRISVQYGRISVQSGRITACKLVYAVPVAHALMGSWQYPACRRV